MIDQTEVLKIAKHAFKRGKGVPDRRIIHPRRDWAVGILIFTTILATGSYYSMTVLSTYRDVDTSGGTAAERVPKYQAEQIERTINTYKDKEAAFNSLINQTTVVIEDEEEMASSTDLVGNATSSVESIEDNEEVVASTTIGGE